MKMIQGLCLALSIFWFIPVQATADSGSASLSCSGNVKLCESCFSNYYYIYAYQYAYVYNGEVTSESHSFSMSGFLGNSGSYKMLPRSAGRHVLYTDGTHTLAIPFLSSDDGIWIMGEGKPADAGQPPQTWIKLCPN